MASISTRSYIARLRLNVKRRIIINAFEAHAVRFSWRKSLFSACLHRADTWHDVRDFHVFPRMNGDTNRFNEDDELWSAMRDAR